VNISPDIATSVLDADAAAIARAGELLRAGQLVAIPTETVYGLAANACDDQAVAAIFAVKKRPRFNPLIVHTASIEEASAHVQFHTKARALAELFWPGGLTLVLPRQASSPLSLLVSAGLDTVAIRVPAHGVARAVIEAAGMPLAAPSANRSGRISPTTAQAVAEELSGRIPLILDAGPCAIGLESTVIGFEGDEPVLLRPGAIAREAIERIAGPLREPPHASLSDEARLAPGMLASHYAPRAGLRLNAHAAKPGEAFLAFGPNAPAASLTCNLSLRGDLTEAAANLFAMLRSLDASGAQTIAVMPIPGHGLGEAINDRLARASAPRDT
jgi:L-threonylcarbamoyladenylate synthase